MDSFIFILIIVPLYRRKFCDALIILAFSREIVKLTQSEYFVFHFKTNNELVFIIITIFFSNIIGNTFKTNFISSLRWVILKKIHIFI